MTTYRAPSALLHLVTVACLLAAPPAFADPVSAPRALSEDDLTPAQQPLAALGSDSPASAQIAVEVSVDKSDLAYKVGDTMSVSVTPKEEAYITIMNVGTSGRVAVLYPNHFQPEAKVAAGTTIRIPGQNAKWNIKVGAPAGVDLIKVIASRKPLSMAELQQVSGTSPQTPIVSLGRTAAQAAKDLAPQLKAEGEGKEPTFGVRNIMVRVSDTK